MASCACALLSQCSMSLPLQPPSPTSIVAYPISQAHTYTQVLINRHAHEVRQPPQRVPDRPARLQTLHTHTPPCPSSPCADPLACRPCHYQRGGRYTTAESAPTRLLTVRTALYVTLPLLHANTSPSPIETIRVRPDSDSSGLSGWQRRGRRGFRPGRILLPMK